LAQIMIVDDEPTIQQLLRIIIEDMGHQVVQQSLNGDAAYKSYMGMEEKPDVVIIDHRMPIMSGMELAQKVLEEFPDQKILFLTADDTVKDQVRDLGITSFLEKPAEIEVIRKAVQGLVDA